MAQKIVSVDTGSPALRAGIRAGDELLRIGGETIVDLLDYEALCAESRVRLLARRAGVETEYDIEKEEYEPLGLNFAQPLMSGMRLCCNHCLFCFVDQLPEHARPSLRLKDDDWRMSLMMGNYVTLTNVSDRELERIVRRHASPLYISVHAMDPLLRSRILGTPRGARLPEQLKALAEGGIEFHAQAVLCPGINDGAALEDTIEKLAAMHPAARSLALVPVGLTDHREGLCTLHKYTPEEARAVLDIAGRWRERLLKKLGTRFVFPSDEFYLAAGRPLPEDGEYEDYEQIDDGVGMLRLLETEFSEAYADLPEEQKQPGGGQNTARRLRRVRGAVSAADVRRPSSHGPDGGSPGAGKRLFRSLRHRQRPAHRRRPRARTARRGVRGGAHLRMHAARWGNGIFGRYDAGRGLPRP